VRALRILVVEDDAKLRGLLLRGLQEHAFAVDGEATGTDGLWRVREFEYDAVVLDVMLPDTDGFEVCRAMRADDLWVPVLMLTARDEVRDRVRGLDVGADDYLPKPFSFDELVARLRALVRRGSRPRPTTLAVGDLVADPASHEVRRGETLPRSRLLAHVWDDRYADPHVVSVYVSYLRRKIDRPFGRSSLRTVRGAGYRLSDDQAR
jgi:two-component system OmpR family response regulator